MRGAGNGVAEGTHKFLSAALGRNATEGGNIRVAVLVHFFPAVPSGSPLCDIAALCYDRSPRSALTLWVEWRFQPRRRYGLYDACEPKAIDKNGKPLAGAAKASFLKKCEAEA